MGLVTGLMSDAPTAEIVPCVPAIFAAIAIFSAADNASAVCLALLVIPKGVSKSGKPPTTSLANAVLGLVSLNCSFTPLM